MAGTRRRQQQQQDVHTTAMSSSEVMRLTWGRTCCGCDVCLCFHVIGEQRRDGGNTTAKVSAITATKTGYTHDGDEQQLIDAIATEAHLGWV